MIEIDGGEGGGQVLRTALTFSAITQSPVELREIRSSRPEPGLRPQHLAAVRTMAEICRADVSECSVGTTALRFEPGEIRSGAYEADIGTAGSAMLLCDTVLPLATTIHDPLVVEVRGGTDVKWAPTSGYYRGVKLPLLREHGLNATLEVDRHGFYPVGGGTATLRLAPSDLSPLSLAGRTQLGEARIRTLATDRLSDADVAERHERSAVEGLAARRIEVDRRTRSYVSADSPGSAVVIELDTESGRAGFDAVGERGVSAEEITAGALDALDGFLDAAAPIDGHLADQVLPFLALAGREARIPAMSDHVETQLEVIRAFGYDLEVGGTDEHIEIRA